MRGMRRTQLRVCPERRDWRASTNTKVSVFGTCDGEPRITTKGEREKGRSRTGNAKFRRDSNTAESTEKDSHETRRDSPDCLGTPASKGWRGFRKDQRRHHGQRRQPSRTAHHATKPGSPKQRSLARVVRKSPLRALQVHVKGERFQDLRCGAQKTARGITSEARRAPGRCHAPPHFRLRSKTVRDSCLRASLASGRGHSTSRRFSGCDTWRPTPFCAPGPACS